MVYECMCYIVRYVNWVCPRVHIIINHVFHAAGAQDIVLTRTVPDPASQELPCPGQSVEFKCQQMVPSGDLVWTLPSGESLRFAAGFADVGATANSSDGNFFANLSKVTDTNDNTLFLFTSTLMIQETVNGMMVSCSGRTTDDVVEENTVLIFTGKPKGSI